MLKRFPRRSEAIEATSPLTLERRLFLKSRRTNSAPPLPCDDGDLRCPAPSGRLAGMPRMPFERQQYRQNQARSGASASPAEPDWFLPGTRIENRPVAETAGYLFEMRPMPFEPRQHLWS